MPSLNIMFPDGLPCYIDFDDEYKPGDEPPVSYMDWCEWAQVQHKAGLRQVKCGYCGLWCFPQELSGKVRQNPICKKCDRLKETT